MGREGKKGYMGLSEFLFDLIDGFLRHLLLASDSLLLLDRSLIQIIRALKSLEGLRQVRLRRLET